MGETVSVAMGMTVGVCWSVHICVCNTEILGLIEVPRCMNCVCMYVTRQPHDYHMT